MEEKLAAAFKVLEDFYVRINADGAELSFSELQRGLKNQGFRRSDELRGIFNRVDRRGTGTLSFPEFLSLFYYFTEVSPYAAIFPKADADAIDSAFSILEGSYLKYDADKSRTLSRAELRNFMAENMAAGVPEGFDALCDEVFPKKSDKLSFKRFLILLYSLVCADGPFAHHRGSASGGAAAARTVSSTASIASAMESTELYRLLKHAFAAVEKDFDRLDTDNDDAISLRELSEGLKPADGGTMVSIVGNLQSLFQKVDLNGDGAIDFSEWLYLTYLLVESASYRDICPSATDASAVKRAFLFLRRAYTAFDADQNMRLDKDEAKAFMTTYLGVVPDNFEGVFDRVCNPVKKTIDYVRFLSLLYEIVAKDGVYIGKVSAAGSDSSASVAKAPAAQPTANPFAESSTTSSAPPPRMDDLRRSEIQLGAEIGSGGFSTVYKAIVRGHPVAVKILKGDVTEEVREEFDSEVAILVMLDHVNVVRLVGSISERDQLCIVTELCSNGSLFDLLHRKRKRLCLKDLARLALELAEGMRHLHDSSLMHRDLKSLNILLDESYSVKVADFGLSKVLRAGVNMHSLGVGTPQWTAPEQLESQKYSTPADVYSYGCVLFEMTHNLIPFAGLDGVQVAMAAIRGERPTISSRCPEFFAGLMRDCWQKDQNLRPTFEDIVERIKRFQTTIARK